jgi:hypothetical protein
MMARGQKRCRCEVTQQPRATRGWCTSELKCFITSTGRKIESRYSRVVCPKCGASWRTLAAYADGLPHPQSFLPGLEGES